MKKILLILGITISGLVFSQQKSPLVIVDGAVTSEAFMKKIDAKKIESVNVYKNSVPDYLKTLQIVPTNGVIDVKMKEVSFDQITLASLNKQNKLAAESPVLFDGMFLKDTKMKIISDAIVKLSVKSFEGRDILHINTF